MADDSIQNARPKENTSAVEALPFFAKILEVILAVFAIGLIVDPYNSFQRMSVKPQTKLDDIAIVYVTIAGYILINAIIMIGYVLGDRMPKRTSILFSAMGAFLFVVAGSVIVHDWRKLSGSYFQVTNNAIYPSKQYKDMMISGAVFAFVDAVVFVIDIFITHRYA